MVQNKKSKDIDNNHGIFEDRDILMSLYLEMGLNARFVADKIWTNARFFTTITSALMTISIAAVVSLLKEQPEQLQGLAIAFLLAILPVMVIVIAIIGIKNLRREYSRFLDWVVIADKLQEKLGLYEQTAFKKYPKDKYLLPLRFVTQKVSNTENFIQTELQKKGSLLFYFKCLHPVYILLAVIMIVMIFLLRIIG